MDKHLNVMKQIIELTDTLKEGLSYISTQLNEGRYEQSLFLFEDVLSAFASIERSTVSVLNDLEGNTNLQDHLTKTRNHMELVLAAYEEKDYAKVKEINQFTLLPTVKQLQDSISTQFSPYVVS